MSNILFLDRQQHAASDTAPPDDGTVAVVELNNMVTPYTDRLFARLRQNGLGIAVLSCTIREANRDWVLDAERRYGHTVLPGVSFRVGPRRYAHWNGGIATALDRLRPKLLVLNGFYPSMLLGWRWARRTGTPIALRIDGGADDMPHSPYHRLARLAVLRDCRAVLTCGNRGTHYFAAQGVARERIFAMPLVPAWDAPPSIPDFGDRAFDLLWVGELENKVKNASFFGAVAKALHRALPRLTLRIIGKGPAQHELLAELASAGVAYRHEPSVDWRQMTEVMTSARLLLLPSAREPWGLVCNEAMQCGTPCLVSDHVGAADELVIDERNGRVLPLDRGAWAEAARSLLLDSDRWTGFAQAARADVAPRSIDAAAGTYRMMVAAALGTECAA